MSKKNKKIEVKGTLVTVSESLEQDYISLTDIARYKDAKRTDYIIQNWLRNRNTIENPDKKGNICDYANVSQLVCLVNLENLNAVFINDGLEQSERLIKLNQIAIEQMKILLSDKTLKLLNPKNESKDE